MKKRVHLFIGVILLVGIIAVRFIFTSYLQSFHKFDEWGIYLLTVPTIYCFIVFFSKSNLLPLKNITIISIGIFIPIFLSRYGELILLKILATLIGSTATWVVTKYSNKAKKNKKNILCVRFETEEL